MVSEQDNNHFFQESRNNLLFYGYIRDVHYTEGFQMILPGNISQEEAQEKLSQMNAVTPVSSKLFSIPQQFIMK